MSLRTVWAFLIVFVGLLGARPAFAQGPQAEIIAYEVSGGWMGFTPRGNVQTNSNRVDFDSDLGMGALQSQFTFRLHIRPSDRKRILFEFTPYRFSGEKTIDRSFRFGGVTYDVNERMTSKASLNFIAAGFQYDFLSRPRVDLSVLGLLTYVGVRAKASSPSAGEAEVNRDIGFPLAGGAIRFSPFLREPGVTIRAEMRGMSFGSYGRYVEGAVALGFALTPYLMLETGYRIVDGVGQHETRGGKFSFRGPDIRLRLHD